MAARDIDRRHRPARVDDAHTVATRRAGLEEDRPHG